MTLRPVADRWEEIIRVGREVTGAVTQAMVITDLGYNIVAWNEQAAELYGWAAEEAIGRPIGDVLPWAGAVEEAASARRELESRGRWHGTAIQVQRDGSIIEVDATTRMIHDRDGSPIGTVSVNSLSAHDLRGAADTELLDEFALAITGGQLVMSYQPIVDVLGRPVKVEALVRWQHPTRGLLMPGTFVPVVEHSPLIAAFTADVLRRACAQVAAWRRDAMPGLELTVNVSGRELSDPTLIDRVQDALDASGLPPSALWLELTETAVLRDGEQASDSIERLRDLGVRFGLDDFGTGFATLAQLHGFPAHALKIDRMFVDGLTAEGSGDAAIVRSVLTLGAELGLVVIAEGVESEAQHIALTRMGCRLFQGYLYGGPAPADPPPPWLTSSPARAVASDQLPAI